ncbi:excisionase family DNA-binding protein [Nordella sp. HKS 07]|uniref:excisionase family DNA-binding protein n=1 Tax=Nordella sp. HKS 07 TaxID=2712222 RepID=UPI0013E201E3|nr:excisionase family DNA-binding protein [Nordella sp. HKS 07]QIG48805.1 excisionase family DNA-binding protein [Nordella sp. HKS 07]
MDSQPTILPLQPVTMSVREAAAYLGAGESTIWKAIRERRLRALKMGRSTRILRVDADAFISSLPVLGEAA